MRNFIFVCTLLAASATSRAQDAVYVGAGQQTCGYWVTARKASAATSSSKPQVKETVVMSWVHGFVVGVWARDGGRHAAFAVPDGPAMQVWLDKYCADNPQDLVMQATLQLVTELSKQGHNE